MNDPICKNCQFFRQHYILDGKKLFRVYCGHCTFQKPKRKLPDSKICDQFIPGADDTEAFASKEYITKELLQYLLKLELLPEITEAPENKPAKKQNKY